MNCYIFFYKMYVSKFFILAQSQMLRYIINIFIKFVFFDSSLNQGQQTLKGQNNKYFSFACGLCLNNLHSRIVAVKAA